MRPSTSSRGSRRSTSESLGLESTIALMRSVRWLNQHETIDRLNIQAHKNALNSTDEFVMDTFVTYEKVRTFENIPLGWNTSVRSACVRDMEAEGVPSRTEGPC